MDQSKVLCTLPVTVLVVIAALDSGDKALLGASFPMLEKTLGLHVDTLGYFSLFTNLSYALCLPLWGYLIHHYTVRYVAIVYILYFHTDHLILLLIIISDWQMKTCTQYPMLGMLIMGVSNFGNCTLHKHNITSGFS